MKEGMIKRSSADNCQYSTSSEFRSSLNFTCPGFKQEVVALDATAGWMAWGSRRDYFVILSLIHFFCHLHSFLNHHSLVSLDPRLVILNYQWTLTSSRGWTGPWTVVRETPGNRTFRFLHRTSGNSEQGPCILKPKVFHFAVNALSWFTQSITITEQNTVCFFFLHMNKRDSEYQTTVLIIGIACGGGGGTHGNAGFPPVDQPRGHYTSISEDLLCMTDRQRYMFTTYDWT